jgi:hypothetical protein
MSVGGHTTKLYHLGNLLTILAIEIILGLLLRPGIFFFFQKTNVSKIDGPTKATLSIPILNSRGAAK